MNAPLHIMLVYSPMPRQVRQWRLELPRGSSAGDALAASQVLAEFPALAAGRLALGIWGRKAPLSQTLHDGDRVEIYRGLLVDPKTARRERFNQQGSRSAGLFASRRAGAKAGY